MISGHHRFYVTCYENATIEVTLVLFDQDYQ